MARAQGERLPARRALGGDGAGRTASTKPNARPVNQTSTNP